MPHELLMQKLQELKELLEKERNIFPKDGWTNLLKMKAQDNVDNAITNIHESIIIQ